MSTQRIQMNAVLLPNGRVLAEGGSENDETPDGPGKKARPLRPRRQHDESARAPQPVLTRLYHSTALLLRTRP